MELLMELWLFVVICAGAAIVAFLIGVSISPIQRQARKARMQRFWGKAALDQYLIVAHGALMDSRLSEQDAPTYRFIKRYHDGRAFQLIGPSSPIAGGGELRAVTYIINCLKTYRRRPIKVVDDATAFHNLGRTIIALGSPLSNEVSELVLREPDNKFLEFTREGNATVIHDKRTGRNFDSVQGTVRKDYGIVMRIPNTRFPGHYFFVCAGLGEWGTSGAAWYLARQWKVLDAEFRGPFGIVVEVEMGSDESARRVHAGPRKRPATEKAAERQATAKESPLAQERP